MVMARAIMVMAVESTGCRRGHMSAVLRNGRAVSWSGGAAVVLSGLIASPKRPTMVGSVTVLGRRIGQQDRPKPAPGKLLRGVRYRRRRAHRVASVRCWELLRSRW